MLTDKIMLPIRMAANRPAFRILSCILGIFSYLGYIIDCCTASTTFLLPQGKSPELLKRKVTNDFGWDDFYNCLQD